MEYAKTKKIKAICNTDKLCWKCLKEFDIIHHIHILDCGYGSRFDSFSTQLQLCEPCFTDSQNDKPIWNMKIVYGNMSYTKESKDLDVEFVDEEIDQRYKYDYEMDKYLSELPLESQELVYNSFIEGTSYHMEPQDWIDYRLGVLPHDKCKEYGLYSPDEKNAYYDRFPMCQYPVQIVYDDGTKGCHCPFGSFGKFKDGEVIADNLSNKCYGCTYYKERAGTVLTIDDKDMPDYRLYIEYHLNKIRLEQKFSEVLKGVI